MTDYIPEIQVEETPSEYSYPFCIDALRKVSGAYIAWLVMGFVLSFVVFKTYQGSKTSSVLPSLFVYYLIVTLHVLFRVSKKRLENVLAPDILFLGMYTTFHLGYVTLYGLGLAPYISEIFIFDTAIPKALFIINIGLISFLLGYEIVGTKNPAHRHVGQVRIPNLNMCPLGLVLMFMAVSIHLMVLVLMAPQFKAHGYAALQRIDEFGASFLVTLLWRYSQYLMVFGLLIYIFSSALRYGRLFNSKLGLGLVVFYFLLIILGGDRGPLLKLGIPLLLARHYFVKKVKLPFLVLMTLGLLTLFTAIAIVRTIVFNPAKMLEEYKYQKGTGYVTWMSPLIEMGGSFLVVDIVAQDVPSQERFWLGDSWKSALIHIVPFLQGYASRQGWVKWDPSDWVTTTYFGEGRAGRAFTIAAEGYLNFGYPGVIVELIFMGMFIRWLTIKFSRSPSIKWGIILLGCLGVSILAIRNHLGIMLSACVQMMLIAYLLVLFFRDEEAFDEDTTSQWTTYDDYSVNYDSYVLD